MDLTPDPADAAFRQEVRAFLRAHLPPALKAKGLALRKPDRDELVAWHRTLCRQGWGAPTWPQAFGGTGWSLTRQQIFEEECTLAGAPRYMPQINMIGPVLARFGTPAQQARFLPHMLDLSHWWCQGYSEPGAGSDLAALRTRARREGDHYIVNGQKIWTSGAPWADWMFALVRTSDAGRPSEGISFLLIDMRSAGIEARWIKGIDGAGTLAQVFLQDVAVPVENLVHEENKGWTVAKYLLGHERAGQAAMGHCKLLLAQLKRLADRTDAAGRRALDDPAWQRKVAWADIELQAHEWTLQRLLSTNPQGPAYSMLKNRGAQLQQMLIELMRDCSHAGLLNDAPEDPTWAAEGLPSPQDIAAAWLDLRKVTLFAGTTEVQNNIIGKALLA